MNKQHTGRETLMQGGNYQKNREGGVPELARQPRIDFAGRCNCPQAARPLIAPLWEDQKHPLYLPAPPSSLLTLQPSIFCLTLGCSWLCEGRWCGMFGGFLPRGHGQDSCLVSEGPWSALKLLENGCATSLCSLYYSLPVCGWLNTACVPENWVCIFMLIKKKKKDISLCIQCLNFVFEQLHWAVLQISKYKWVTNRSANHGSSSGLCVWERERQWA